MTQKMFLNQEELDFLSFYDLKKPRKSLWYEIFMAADIAEENFTSEILFDLGRKLYLMSDREFAEEALPKAIKIKERRLAEEN